MDRRVLGTTGLPVAPLALGGATVGQSGIPEKDAERFLNAAVDAGVNLIDTSIGYDMSETYIGRFLAGRRDEIVLSSKVGYRSKAMDPSLKSWTYACTMAGVDHSLQCLRTDYVDIMHLHSCGRDALEGGEVIEALEDAVQAGKIRFVAYSGENDALQWALESGRFAVVQTSVSVADQADLVDRLPLAARAGIGVIAKRPLAEVAWRHASCPAGDYCEEYWRRLRKMAVDLDEDPVDTALRFVVFTPGVHSAAVGTANIEHVAANIRSIERGPLPEELYAAIREAFAANDDGWAGLV
jgi:aryl-alcohol dehydrogenase-like predicted oxidoreductase